MSNGTQALIYVINTLFQLYISLVVLRFLLQLVRADFYNPLSQFIVQATAKPLQILRRVIPAAGRIDTASIVLAVLLQLLNLVVLALIIGSTVSAPMFLIGVPLKLANHVLDIYFFALIAYVILSWVDQTGQHWLHGLLGQLLNPLLNPIRNVIPAMGGFDLSPLFLIMGIHVVRILIS